MEHIHLRTLAGFVPTMLIKAKGGVLVESLEQLLQLCWRLCLRVAHCVH